MQRKTKIKWSVLEEPTEQEDVGNGPSQVARFTIHVPLKDNDGRDIPHVLGAVRKTLTKAGFHGRTVITGEGDWQDFETEPMALVMIDAPDTDQVRYLIHLVGEGIKALAGQEAVYVTITPIETMLI